MKKRARTFTISAVAEQFELHPQTLRLYEREGLLKPSRSEGNTRLYTDTDLERLEIILSLTRDLGVNLAGVGLPANPRRRVFPLHRTAARSRRFGSRQPYQSFCSRQNARRQWQIALSHSLTLGCSYFESLVDTSATILEACVQDQPGLFGFITDSQCSLRQSLSFGLSYCLRSHALRRTPWRHRISTTSQSPDA